MVFDDKFFDDWLETQAPKVMAQISELPKHLI